MVKLVLSILIGVGFSSFNAKKDSSITKIILKQFVDSLENINDARYKVENIERIDGEYMRGSQYINYQKSPFKCKVEFITPNTGSQVVFTDDYEDATYSPVGFPYFDVSLNPLGSLMRRNNHHTVYEIGFEYISNIINAALTDPQLSYRLIDTSNKTIEIIVSNNKFEYVDYIVQKNEDVRRIANSKNLSEYLILEKNEDLDFYDDISENDVIKIPSSYAKEVRFVVEKKNLILVDIAVIDDKGLFEQYHYSDVEKNIKTLNFQIDN